MNWIRCDYEGFQVLGQCHIRRLEVKAGAEARTVTIGDTTTTHHDLPGNGWLVIAWCDGVHSGPRCVGRYDSEQFARRVLAVIFQELRDSVRAVDVPTIRAKL